MLSQGYIKGLRRCWRNGASGLLMPLCKYGWGLRRTRDKDGGVESKTEFKGELGKFKKGGVK